MSSPILTTQYLRKRLRWPEVERRETLYGCEFCVLPAASGCKSIDFVFDHEVQCLHSVRFFSWKAHAHFEQWGCELRNIVDAVREVYSLVHLKHCLVEGLDVAGEYVQSDRVHLGESPNMLARSVKSLRRVCFNRPPSQERVDFSNYVEEGHHFVKKSYREELNRLMAPHGSGV